MLRSNGEYRVQGPSCWEVSYLHPGIPGTWIVLQHLEEMVLYTILERNGSVLIEGNLLLHFWRLLHRPSPQSTWASLRQWELALRRGLSEEEWEPSRTLNREAGWAWRPSSPIRCFLQQQQVPANSRCLGWCESHPSIRQDETGVARPDIRQLGKLLDKETAIGVPRNLVPESIHWVLRDCFLQYYKQKQLLKIHVPTVSHNYAQSLQSWR